MQKLLKFLPRKVVYALLTGLVELGRAAVQARHPTWVLPTTDQVLIVGAALIGAHTLTDVVAILKDAVVAWAQTKREPS